MNDQELYVPDITSDNGEDTAPEVPLQEAAPPEELVGEQQAEAAVSEETLEGEEATASEPQVPEPVAEVAEAAQQVFGTGVAKPLVVNLHLTSTKPGHFVPTATIEIGPSLRTSGLLAAMSAEEVKTLVALLTFLSPNGDIKPTAHEVAQGLNISEGKAKEWLSRLARFRWQSKSIVATLWRETGMDGYTLSHEFVSYREAAPPASTAPQPAYRAAGREAVIAASRSKYSRPRAEVERQIAMMQGWPLPEEQAQQAGPVSVQAGEVSPVDYLLQRLLRLGVTAEQAELLLETFPPEEIELQIAWLPYRGAKNPASYLVAAITGGYEEPGLLRMRREQQQANGYAHEARGELDPPAPDMPLESGSLRA